MIELQNVVDSQKFIRVVKALGAANTYSDLELGYIYHGLDDMGVDPQLFFNYDLNVIVRNTTSELSIFVLNWYQTILRMRKTRMKRGTRIWRATC